MKSFFKKSASLLITGFSFIITNPVLAQDTFGLQETGKEAGFKTDSTTGPAGFFGILIGYILAFVGVIFFALMVYGGFIWMTARGNKEKVDKAINLIEQSAIGIIIIFLSYVITNLVLTRVTGAVNQ